MKRDEAEALLNTIDSFGEEVLEAIKIIQEVKGKGHLIITGVGKSGHPGICFSLSISSYFKLSVFMIS